MSLASVRASLCGVVCAIALANVMAQAAELISVTQARPGEIVARVSIPSAATPPAEDFALQLDSETRIPAVSVLSAADPARSALLICLDRSGSMGAAAVAAMRDALRTTLVPRAGESQLPLSVAIVAFGTRSSHLVGLTSDPALIAEAAARLGVDKERDGKTRLYDAVAGGLAELRGFAAASKRLLVVSDGDDEGSALKQLELIDIIRSASPKIQVDAIGFGELAASASGSLSTLAGATGGRFAVARTHDERGLAVALGQMIRERLPDTQYDVSFNYVPAADGRKVEAAKLAYRPQDGAAASMPLPLAVIAAAGSVAPGAERAATPAPGSKATLESAGGLPPFTWLIAGALLLVVFAVIAMRVRKREKSTVTDLGGERAETRPPGPAAQDPVAAKRNTRIAYRWPSPGEGRTIAILRGISGVAQGAHFTMTAAAVSIGAAPDNDLPLAGDDFISGHHLSLKAEANGLYVVDLGSRNGSELNGEKFKDGTRSLSPGDRITLGHATFEVLVGDAVAGTVRPAYEPRVR